MRRTLLLLALLAACGRDAPVPPAPVPSFREAGSLIASTTRGGPADLVGDWVVSASYEGGTFLGGPLPGSTIVVGPSAGGAYTWTVVPPGGVGWVSTTLQPVGLGRLASGQAGVPELWILWVDDDFRTAAVGTPDGSFGWIMDRPGASSPDRARAAREMLDFNGYDLGRLPG